MIRFGLMVSVLCIGIMCGLWFWLAREMPADAASVPVHWGLDGRADRFVSGAEAVRTFGLLPGLGAALALLLAFAPVVDPFRENLRKSARGYLIAWAGGMMLLTAIAALVAPAMLAAGKTGGAATLDLASGAWPVRIVLALIAALVLFLGDALPKTRKNFLLGVRTPWTLTSDLAWEKTHRLVGRLFVLTGVWGLATAFWLDVRLAILALVIPLVASAVVGTVFSFLVWRKDPDRAKVGREHPAAER